MIKWIGVGFILFSCGGIGFEMKNKLEKRIEALRTIKRIIFMLRGEIKYGNAPLGEAFASIGNRMESPYREFLMETAKEMEHLNGKTFQGIWKQMKENYLKGLPLLKKDWDHLLDFGDHLGYLDKEMQLNTIELYLEQLEEEILSAQGNLKKNGKLYQSLGIMGGILITILII